MKRVACSPRAPARWRSKTFACMCWPRRVPPAARIRRRARRSRSCCALPRTLRCGGRACCSSPSWPSPKPESARPWLSSPRGATSRSRPAEREQFDSLAWTIGRATGDEAVQREAARRLLVHSPLAAARLDVAGVLVTRPQGDWREFLSPADLLARAAALLQVDVPQGALATLDAVPQAARTFEWSLLRARALTAAQRGNEALNELSLAGAVLATDRTGNATGDQRATLELERAHAVADAAAVRRGRPALAAAERARLRAKGSRPCAARSSSRPLPSSRRRRSASSMSSSRPPERSTPRSPCCTSWRRSRPAMRSARGRSGSAAGASTWPATGAAPSATGASCATSIRRSPTAAAPTTGRDGPSRSSAIARARAPSSSKSTRADTADFYSRQAALRLAGAPSAGRSRARRRSARSGRATARIDRARWLSDLALDKLAAAELDRVAAVGRRTRRGRAARPHPRPHGSPPREPPRAAQGLPAARDGPSGDRPARRPRALLSPPLRRPGGAFRGREIAAGVAGLRHRPPGERLRPRGEEPLRGARPDAADAVDRPRARAPARDELLHAATVRARIQSAPRYDILPADAGDVRQRSSSRSPPTTAVPGGSGASGASSRPSGEVDRFLEGLAIVESRNYVKRILVLAESYRSLYSDLS